jgi:hypothetical protein
MSEANGYMTEERLAFREQARDFTEREVLPVANQLDPEKVESRSGTPRRSRFGIKTGPWKCY